MTRRVDLRRMFNDVAGTYHKVRPRYPEQLFDHLRALSGISIESQLLEIGCGTGIATVALARRGHRITAIELGAELADQARANLSQFPSARVVEASFDTWVPERWGSFDLVFAASAWHWPDPESKYQLAHRHLRPGGSLAFWSASHVIPADGDSFFIELQDVYDDLGESPRGGDGFAAPGGLPTLEAEIVRTGLFEMIGVRQFDWETAYNVSEFIALLDTFSDHMAMEPQKRDRLYSEIRARLAARPDGMLRRHSGSALHIARRI